MRYPRILIISMILIALIVPSLYSAPSADAASGSFTIAPGETRYLSYGTASVDDLLLWSLSIDYLGWSLTYWLENPNGIHLTLAGLVSCKIVDVAGIWKIGFNISSIGFWSATIDYEVYSLDPTIVITSPSNDACLNTSSIIVSGIVSPWANYVQICLYGSPGSVPLPWFPVPDYAVMYGNDWSCQLSFQAQGSYRIEAVQTIEWGFFLVTFSDTIDVTFDNNTPSLAIISPTANQAFSAKNITVTWAASDNNPVLGTGIKEYQVSLDYSSWKSSGTVPSYTFRNLTSGYHNVSVKAIDKAGNWNSTRVAFLCDFVAPSIWNINILDDSVIRMNALNLTWQASDALSGLHHYEIKVDSNGWIDIGMIAQYQTNLPDGWHDIRIKAVDKAGNSVISYLTINTTSNAWSLNGPYYGFPLFAIIAAIIVLILFGILRMYSVKRKAKESVTEPAPEESLSTDQEINISMHCPECGEPTEGRKFCGHCGVKLG